jgi:hypothetical protein
MCSKVAARDRKRREYNQDQLGFYGESDKDFCHPCAVEPSS